MSYIFLVRLLIYIESILETFLSTNDSIVLELTLAFPTITTFLISEKELLVKKNKRKKIVKILINLIRSYKIRNF